MQDVIKCSSNKRRPQICICNLQSNIYYLYLGLFCCCCYLQTMACLNQEKQTDVSHIGNIDRANCKWRKYGSLFCLGHIAMWLTLPSVCTKITTLPFFLYLVISIYGWTEVVYLSICVSSIVFVYLSVCLSVCFLALQPEQQVRLCETSHK